MHIGEKIREVMEQKHRSVVWVARQIGCERTNVYNIFARKDINTSLLRQLCVVLDHDFFKDLSKDTLRKGRDAKVA